MNWPSPRDARQQLQMIALVGLTASFAMSAVLAWLFAAYFGPGGVIFAGLIGGTLLPIVSVPLIDALCTSRSLDERRRIPRA